MRITVRHHFDFGADRSVVGDDLMRAAAWDALRTGTSGTFALAHTRDELERTARARADIGARARAIDRWLTERNVQALASYGVGGAVLEWWLLHISPERRLVLAEYAPKTLERLHELFPEVDVRRHDLLEDPPLPADIHLFHRIDTELTDAQWPNVFTRFKDETVLVAATELATARRLVAELILRIRRRDATRAGWLRTRDSFEALWRTTHDAEPLRFHDLDGWVLTPRRP